MQGTAMRPGWRRIRRILAGLLLAVPLLLALLAAAGWWSFHGSLARLDGQQPLASLSAAVSIQRDSLGVATIEADNALDAARALGWLHAQERWFEMDVLRRNAAGELSAVFGPRALQHDRQQRRHRMRWRAQQQLQRLPANQRAQLSAYAEGANAGLAALNTRPWPYLLLRQQPQPWAEVDSLLVGYAMYFDLQDAGNRRELALARLQPHLPPALHALLAHGGSQWDAPLLGESLGDATLPDADTIDLRKLAVDPDAPLAPISEPDYPGSNNFAVAGELTADGRAILANDMHLALRAPNLWFRARLRYPEPSAAGGRVDVVGFTLPGLPSVIVGSNGHVAWGFTNSYGDWMDWQRVPACSGMQVAEERIDIAGAQPQVLAVRSNAWGPVLHDEANGDCLVLRWAAHLPGSLNLDLGEMAAAGDIDTALAVARHMALPAQNLLLADANGRIAWRLAGPRPQRTAACQPTAIDDPQQCPPWPLTHEDMPHVLDPANARLWTANARTVYGAALRLVGDGGYALGSRAHQIRGLLDSREQFDEADLLAIQLDDRAVLLTRWWSVLKQSTDAGPATSELARAARHWEGHAGIDSVSYRVVREWRREVQARMLDGLLAPARTALGQNFQMPDLSQFEGVAWPLLEQRPMHLLSPRFADWNALLEDAAQAVIAGSDTPLPQRNWGQANLAAICHPLAEAVPVIGKRLLCMPREPLPGDGLVPRVQAPSFGASQRIVVAPGHEAKAIAHMPGGQSGHPLSPFWGAGHDDWAHGRPTPLLPGEAKHQLQLTPSVTTP